jgi:hypothetical protein
MRYEQLELNLFPNDNKFILPLLRRSFPELITNEITSVQPMSGPVGLAFALRYRFEDNDIDPLEMDILDRMYDERMKKLLGNENRTLTDVIDFLRDIKDNKIIKEFECSDIYRCPDLFNKDAVNISIKKKNNQIERHQFQINTENDKLVEYGSESVIIEYISNLGKE